MAADGSSAALQEASDHWAIAAGALLADRELFLTQFDVARPPAGASDLSLSDACANDPGIARSLALVCHHGLHGLLMQWSFDEASSRLQSVAVSATPVRRGLQLASVSKREWRS